MTTPDIIATARDDIIRNAREAAHDLWARAQAVTCELPKRMFLDRRLADITTAFDYAEALQANVGSCAHVLGEANGEIEDLNAVIEKLKAERDEARSEITHWFDLAGFNMRGGGFHSYKEEADRLKAALAEAERVIKPFADENEAQTEERVPFVFDDERPHTFYRATYANLAASSQWLKGRAIEGECG